MKGHDPLDHGSNHSKKQQAGRIGTRRKGRRRPFSDQRFSSYLSFGFHMTVCLALFLVCYILILVCMFPLLVQEAPRVVPTHRGEVLKPVVEKMKEGASRLGHSSPGDVAHAAVSVAMGGQHLAEKMVVSIQHKVQQYRQSEGVTDASLMQHAVGDIEKIRRHRREQQHRPKQEQSVDGQSVAAKTSDTNAQKKKVSGFVVLGMHRSGTSMLSGLLSIGMGYHTGGPLIGSAFDNKKGFFELVPAVLQNDEFMSRQRIWWSSGVIDYDYRKALDDKKTGRVTFQEGEQALRVLNSPDKVPFLQKDPRMCITLKTWLPLLNSEPAILFTYRHPLEVAQSLQRRENDFSLEHGLRLWIIYNMRAIQNSNGLCRVTTSNEAVLAHPLAEVNRTSYELTTKCNVPPPPIPILSQEDVDKFVDSGLQHTGAQIAAQKAGRQILATHNDGSCPVYEYDSDYDEATQASSYARERGLYLTAMKIYCDFQSGAAYQPNYEWPELN